jgi:thioredoxin-related protein
MKRLFGAVGLGLIAMAAPSAAKAAWMTDFEAAKELARREDKNLLLYFTGTDWCAWCIQLKREVFDQAAFKAYGAEHFVLVELDFPRRKKLDPKLAKQNQSLAESMAVNGYPTVMLCDPDGRPFARTGYRPGGVDSYLGHLEVLRRIRHRRDRALASAEPLEGVERAGKLVEALSTMEADLAEPAYSEVIAEILRLDPSDVHGMARARGEKARHEALLRARSKLLRDFFTGTIRPLIESRDFDRLDPALLSFLEKHPSLPDENRQILTFNVGLARYRADGDHEAMAAVIDRLGREYPESQYALAGQEMKRELRVRIEVERERE